MLARRTSRASSRTRWLSVTLGTLLMVALTVAMTLGGSSGVDVAGSAPLGLGASTLVICKNGNVTGTFLFSINNAAPVSVVAGTCVPETVENGLNTVTELPDPTGATVLTAIAVTPTVDGSGSVATRTATVNIPANGTATTTFTNTPVSHLVVCKHASDNAVPAGPWQFAITNATTGATAASASVTVGGCSNPIQLPPANYKITETFAAPDYVDSVTVSPTTALVGSPSLGTGSVTVTVGSGSTTTVTFTNDTDGSLSVCKAASDKAVPAGPWQFAITNATTGATVGSASVLVGNCSTPLPVPAGNYKITETFTSPDYVDSITVAPTTALVGSPSLTSGSVTVTVSAGSTTTATFTNDTLGSLVVCKAASDNAVPPGPWQFTITDATTGSTVTSASVLVGKCSSPLPVPAGNYKITETFALPDAVDSITVSPPTALVGSPSLSTGSVTVTVTAGSTTTATFTNDTDGNLVICKAASDGSVPPGPWQYTVTNTATGATVATASVLVGKCSSAIDLPNTNYTVTETFSAPDYVDSITVVPTTALVGSPSLSTGSVTVTVSAGANTTATFTNDTLVTPGDLMVCKAASDGAVPPGPWQFTVTDATTGATVTSASVLVGKCSSSLPVPAGNYKITETFAAPDYVDSITVSPTTALVGSPSLSTGSVTVTVTAGSTTTATFTNDTDGNLVICKAASDGSVPPGPWQYTITNTATGATVATASVLVGKCSSAIALPNTNYTVTETFSAPDYVDSITVVPTTAVVGSPSLSTGSVTVTVSAGATTTATFTNDTQTNGWLEVCKKAGDASVGTTSFQFSINGGAQFTVQAGQCSQPFQVPVGTATIQEFQTDPNFTLANVSTVSVTDPGGSRLLGWNAQTGVATVTIVPGTVVNETIATFTNATRLGAFKICTGQTSPGAALAGVVFPYLWSYTSNGVTSSGTVHLAVQTLGLTCSAISASIPVINADGTPVDVSVTAQAPSVSSVDLATFLYQGAGVMLTTPKTPGTFPQTATFSLGAGINITTFTNGATH